MKLLKAISEAIHRRTNNAMADKRTKRKTIQWSTNGQKDKQYKGLQTDKKTNNTMADKRTKRQTMVLLNNTQKAKRLVILPPLMPDAILM